MLKGRISLAMYVAPEVTMTTATTTTVRTGTHTHTQNEMIHATKMC